MADYAAMPSCTRTQFLNISFPRNVNTRISTRDYSFSGRSYLTCRHVSPKSRKVGSPLYATSGGSHCLKGSSTRCCCLATLINAETVVPVSWASSIDEALLVISIVLAYMAGAIPNTRSVSVAGKYNDDKVNGASTSIPYGRTNSSGKSSEKERESDSNDFWLDVKEKLLDALSRDLDGNLHGGTLDSEVNRKRSPLSMLALHEGPRLRLLWATLQQLQKEINDVPQNLDVASEDIWLLNAKKVISDTVQPACIKWLEDELAVKSGNPSTKLIDRISEKLKGDDTISQNIERTGKNELYADLLFFLRFGYLRTASCYDSTFLTSHGVNILEDLVITVADGVASIYLELISVDSNMSNEINVLGLNLCVLSTRTLQKLRNEVALNQWLHQNFESIVSMYEDRFELSILCWKDLKDPLESKTSESIWSKMLTLGRLKPTPSLSYIEIGQVSLPVKRIKELRALTGWRYYFSLFLEFSDIAMPFIKTIFTKVSNAVSYFLTYMIGRSLGLIFSGIRQSLGWK